MKIPIAPVCWPLSSLAETVTSDHASAACYRTRKHIGIATVVIAKLKFRDIQRQIFGTDLMETADDTALKNRPETLNRIGVDSADHVLIFLVRNRLTRIFDQTVIDAAFVSGEQANFVRYHFAHEGLRVLAAHLIENAGHHVALAFNRANDRNFAGTLAATTAGDALVDVLVVILAANPSLIDLDNAAKLLLRGDQRSADFVTHKMGRIVTAEAHHALNLKGAHSLLAGQHQMGDAIPVAERLLGVLENRPRHTGKPIAVRRTLAALPVKRLVARCVVQVGIAAARAMNAFRPAPSDQVPLAGFLVTNRETSLKLGRGHLRNWFRTFCHDDYPSSLSMEGYCHV